MVRKLWCIFTASSDLVNLSRRCNFVLSISAILCVSQANACLGVEPPKTVNEALAVLQKTLGVLDPDNPKPWKFEGKVELKSRDNPDTPELLIKTSFKLRLNQPFVEGESICFTETYMMDKKVFEVQNDGSDKLLHNIGANGFQKWTLILIQGVWFANVKHHSSLPSLSYMPGKSGVVTWTESGFEFDMNSGVDEFFAVGGGLRLGVPTMRIKYSLNDGRLQIDQLNQGFEFLKRSDGGVIIAPDFSKPLFDPEKISLVSLVDEVD